MDRLRVAVLGPLDEQGHHPRRQSGNGMPIERLALEQEPENAIGADDEERGGVGSECAELREMVPQPVHCAGRRLMVVIQPD